jgi:RNA 2',3'-cyclic 3'-phosphodiesterase
MPRLFVAVWPPDDVLDLLAGVERPAIDGLRWTTSDQWHVTLRFLGDTGVEPVAAALAGVDAAPVRAELGPAVDRFDNRILHVPVHGLEPLAAAIVAATGALGRRPDDRPFRGHVTLARVGKAGRVDLRRLAGVPLHAVFDADCFCLVQSRLSGAGSQYEVLERFPLGDRQRMW